MAAELRYNVVADAEEFKQAVDTAATHMQNLSKTVGDSARQMTDHYTRTFQQMGQSGTATMGQMSRSGEGFLGHLGTQVGESAAKGCRGGMTAGSGDRSIRYCTARGPDTRPA